MNKHLVLFSTVILLTTFPAKAERSWIGGTAIKEISYVRSNGNCSPEGGPCLRLRFSDGYSKCEWVSINEEDPHYKNIQSLALVSLTAGKTLSFYGSDEYCQDSDRISINNVTLK